MSTLSETSFMLSSDVEPRLKASKKGQVALTAVPMLLKLLKLESLSSQLIQLAKCHQTLYILCFAHNVAAYLP